MLMNTLIVDDEKPARDELAFLLKGFPEISIIGQGKNGLEAVTMIKEHNPDLVFLDLTMPALDGRSALRELGPKARTCEIVVVTATDRIATAVERRARGPDTCARRSEKNRPASRNRPPRSANSSSVRSIGSPMR